MYGAPSSAYQQDAVTTASPARLVLMCYDGVLAALTRSLQAGSPEAVNAELQRAQAILTELQVTLDFEQGGAIARNLSALYTFAIEQLVEANVRKDLSGLDSVVDIVAQLRATWEQACCTTAVA